jgi:hypothetical protein
MGGVRMLAKSLILVAAAFLSGCVNVASYDQFYTHQAPTTHKPTKEIVYVDGDPDADKTHQLLFGAFLVVGRLDFNGPWEGEEPYIAYGKKVGADIVIASTEFDRERQVQGSYSMPTTNTTYLSGYGSYGSYYSGTATTYGSTNVPYSYTVKRYDHSAVFLKRVVPDAKAPWEYTKSEFESYTEESDYNGLWKNDNYLIEVLSSKDDVVGLVVEAGDQPQASLKEKNPILKWVSGDLKFRFDQSSNLGLYLMASKSPRPARISINKFGHLEVQLDKKNKFSFMKVPNGASPANR